MQEYYDLLEEFMSAVKQNYGEKVLIQVSNSSERVPSFQEFFSSKTTELVIAV